MYLPELQLHWDKEKDKKEILITETLDQFFKDRLGSSTSMRGYKRRPSK